MTSSLPSGQKLVAVIGSGASGLAAIKSCLDEKLTPVCFERTNSLGGLWRYTDQPIEGQGCVMKSTVINTSKEMMSYSDFPIPEKYPIYMHNTQVLEYFESYAAYFGLTNHIRFNTEVLSVQKATDFEISGRWEITHRNLQSKQEQTELFAAVLVCTGHHADKYLPTFPGLDHFQGKVIHTHDYRTPEGFQDKRILVVGIGNSGGDVAVELSRRASQLFLSTRRGTWILNRVSHKGLPSDMINSSRAKDFLFDQIPALGEFLLKRRLNTRIDHDLYRLRPDYGPLSQHPLVNDDLPNRLICGSIKVKADIRRFTKTGVEFVDGTFEDNIDVVMMATGYSFGFPFIDREILDVQENRVQLYKYMYPPDLAHRTLAVIGCFQPLGAIMPISEIQCRLATRVIKGDVVLPDSAEMWKDIREKEAALAKRYTKSRRHTIQVDYSQFMDELAQLVGCSIDIYDLFVRDPRLALKVLFGPVTPYTYRLYGPGQWAGAREAIMNQWKRIEAPLKTRQLPSAGSRRPYNYFLMLIVLLVVYFVWRLLFH